MTNLYCETLIDELSDYPNASSLNFFTNRIGKNRLIEDACRGDIEELNRHLTDSEYDSNAERRNAVSLFR